MATRHGTISPTLRAGVPFRGALRGGGGGGWRSLCAPTHVGGGRRWELYPAWPKKPGGVPWARGPLRGRTSDSPGGTPLYGMVWYGMVWYGMVWYGMVWYGMVWYGMVWYGMAWHVMVWYGRAPLHGVGGRAGGTRAAQARLRGARVQGRWRA